LALRVYNTLTRSKELFQKKHAYVADGDILGGGMDLIFPHHENEIAQSEAYSGKPFVKYWLHNGMVHFGADKMSKSLGNVVPTNDLIEKYSGEVVRFYILTSHYRSPLNYAGEKTIEEARTALDRLYTACDLVKAWTEAEANDEALFEIADDAEASELQSVCMDISTRFIRSMDDDFNTPEVLASMFDLSRKVLQIKASLDSGGNIITPALKVVAEEVEEIFNVWGGIIGIFYKERGTIEVASLAGER
jgi:cysteinyl-tRNA synthetase